MTPEIRDQLELAIKALHSAEELLRNALLKLSEDEKLGLYVAGYSCEDLVRISQALEKK